MTYVIRMTEEQFANVIADLDIIEADNLTPSTIRDLAQRIRETLWDEAEHPAQRAAERAEAMGEEPYFGADPT